MSPRIEKPTPAAISVKKLAQNNHFSLRLLIHANSVWIYGLVDAHDGTVLPSPQREVNRLGVIICRGKTRSGSGGGKQKPASDCPGLLINNTLLDAIAAKLLRPLPVCLQPSPAARPCPFAPT